jgi:hypothetical protein
MRHFAQALHERPQKFEVSASESAALTQAIDAFADAVLRATEPGARRVAPPDSTPVLMLLHVKLDGHLLKLGRDDVSTRSAKPDGVTAMQLFRRFDDAPTGVQNWSGVSRAGRYGSSTCRETTGGW